MQVLILLLKVGVLRLVVVRMTFGVRQGGNHRGDYVREWQQRPWAGGNGASETREMTDTPDFGRAAGELGH